MMVPYIQLMIGAQEDNIILIAFIHHHHIPYVGMMRVYTHITDQGQQAVRKPSAGASQVSHRHQCSTGPRIL